MQIIVCFILLWQGLMATNLILALRLMGLHGPYMLVIVVVKHFEKI